MMIKFLAPLVVSVVVYGSIVNAAVTDKYRTESGAECSASYENNHKFEFGFESAPSVSTGLDGNATSNIKPFAKYSFSFGGDTERSRIDCTTTQNLEQERMKIDNERLLVELELLKEQLNATKNKVTVTDTGPLNEKW
jgi:hypothetical protein